MIWARRFLIHVVVLALSIVLLGCSPALGPRFAGVARYELPGVLARSVAPSGDGGHWLVLNAPRELRIYRDFSEAPRRHSVAEAVISAGWLDGQRVFVASHELDTKATGADTQRVAILDIDLHELSAVELPKRDPPLSAHLIAVSSSGRFIAEDSAVYDAERAAWGLAPNPHAGQNVLAFSGDNWVLTASYHDERVVVRSLRSDTRYEWLAPKAITSATFDPQAQVVFVGTEDGVFAWHVVNGSVKHSGVGRVQSVRLCDTRRTLAVLSERRLSLLDATTLTKRLSLRLRAEGAQLAADGEIVVAGDDGGAVYALDARKARLLASASVLTKGVSSIAVHARTRRAVAATAGQAGSSIVVLTLPR